MDDSCRTSCELLIDWDDLREVVLVKTNALIVEDEESGLLLFMMAAVENESEDVMGLEMVHELLRMNPAVLKDYGFVGDFGAKDSLIVDERDTKRLRVK